MKATSRTVTRRNDQRLRFKQGLHEVSPGDLQDSRSRRHTLGIRRA